MEGLGKLCFKSSILMTTLLFNNIYTELILKPHVSTNFKYELFSSNLRMIT